MAATLVADDWTLDPLEPAGAAELYRRVDAAEPRRVRRGDLEGHVGLTDRELYELGCTPAPLDVKSLGAMIGLRVAVLVGAVGCAVGLAGGVAGAVVPLLGGPGDPDPLPIEAGLGIAVVFLALAAGGRALMRRGVEALRRLSARRRRTGRRAARRASEDRHARATVAVVRGPGVLRVQLLWLRGDAADPAYAEVRVLAEVRHDEDDAGRAEDAVATLSEAALRADNAHSLRLEHGGGRRFTRRSSARGEPPPSAPHAQRSPRLSFEVDDAWAPEPLTDDGAAELARRVALARPQRWTAAALAPLLVNRPPTRPDDPPPWPRDPARRRAGLDLRRLARWPLWAGLTTFVFAMFWGEGERPSGTAVLVGCIGLAVAALAAALPRLRDRRDPARRLARAARAAAARPPRALEQSLAGGAGLIEVARGQGRIELLHIRAAPNDGRAGELEVRTLAFRPGAQMDVDAIHRFCTIASDARVRSHGVGRSTRRVRDLLARLGRVPAPSGERGLAREPLAWFAAAMVALLVAASIKHTIAGTWLEDGAASRVLSYSWPLFSGYLALSAARRIRDPYAL